VALLSTIGMCRIDSTMATMFVGMVVMAGAVAMAEAWVSPALDFDSLLVVEEYDVCKVIPIGEC
jgi:hypothetical protein